MESSRALLWSGERIPGRGMSISEAGRGSFEDRLVRRCRCVYLGRGIPSVC